MYRALNIKLRSEQIQELARQLDVLESSITGPFVLGQQISHADGALFPTLVTPAACLHTLLDSKLGLAPVPNYYVSNTSELWLQHACQRQISHAACSA